MYLEVGMKVEMKKPHPCGENKWLLERVGADIKIRCLGCDRQIMLPRKSFEKGMKKILG